jgi:2Fe-2S ferredoxin
MPSITFLPAGVSESYRDGETIFEVGRRAGVSIDTACVGKGTCGLCRVRIAEGQTFLNAYTDEEQKHLGNVYHITRVRLACRSVVAGGDIVVDMEVRKRERSRRR